jgi:hypothetical protein
MAENVTLGSFASLQNSSIISTLNANNTLIENAFADCFSLTGQSPNQMQANVDMNNFNILNLPPASTINGPVRIVDINVSSASLSPSLFALLAVANNFTNINTFSNTTQSTTSTNGAVVVSGGLGVAKNLSVGGALQVSGSFNVATIFGGILPASTLTLASTSNVSPSGDSTSIQGSKIFFKSANGGSTFGDYNNTTVNTWTFTGNVNVVGNLGVTGSSSTFSFSGADLGLGTATPVHNGGFATLTVNGSTGGIVQFQNVGTNTAQIYNSSATNLRFNMISASGTFEFLITNNAVRIFDYGLTNAGAWTFSKPVFINGALVDAAGTITANQLFGGSAANSTLTLTSTSNGTPSGDNLILRGSSITFQNLSLTALGNYNASIANSWFFPPPVVGGSSGGQVTTGFQVRSAVPGFGLQVTTAGVDQKWWDIVANAGPTLIFRTVNDANNATTNWLTVNRGTGIAITSIVLNSGSIYDIQIGGSSVASYNLGAANKWVFANALGINQNGIGLGSAILNVRLGLNLNFFVRQSTNVEIGACTDATAAYAPLIVSGTSVSFTGTGTNVGDYNLTNGSAWTFRAVNGFVVDTAVGTMISATSANTGGINNILINNTGTSTNSATTARFGALITGLGGGGFFILQAIGGSGGTGLVGQIISGSSLTNGIQISTQAGLLVLNANTNLVFQQNNVTVGDYGLTAAGQWTFTTSSAPFKSQTANNIAMVTYRQANAITNQLFHQYNLQDINSAEQCYAQLTTRIVSNTAGAIVGGFAISCAISGSVTNVLDYAITTTGQWTMASPFTLNAGTLGNGVSAFTLTATQPTTPVAPQNAVTWTITSAGSASQANRGMIFTYAAGYTGGSPAYALFVNSAVASTGVFTNPAAGSNNIAGNVSVVGSSTANGTGSNTGVAGFGGGTGGSSINVGVYGSSQLAVNSATNIGVAGTAVNTGTSPVMVGGWFSLNQTTVPTVSAALIADNGAQSQPVALFRVAGVTKFQVDSTGSPIMPNFTVATLPAAPAAGAVAMVTDATALVAKGATATGGGAVKCVMFWTGAAWQGI